MEEEKIIRLHPRLARKYLEANSLYGEQKERLKVLGMIDVAMEKQKKETGEACCRWTVWVYAKFEYPNLVLGFINRLYGRWPRLAEWLASSANAEFLLGVFVFVVREEADKTTIVDFGRI
jgi:hypothetical protein